MLSLFKRQDLYAGNESSLLCKFHILSNRCCFYNEASRAKPAEICNHGTRTIQFIILEFTYFQSFTRITLQITFLRGRLKGR